MTKQRVVDPIRAARSRPPAAAARCRWCGRALPPPISGRGRPRRYCRQGCRQQAHLARKLAAAHGLGDDEVVVGRTEVEDLQVRLFCLLAALDDVERDLQHAEAPGDVRDALAWLMENAVALREAPLEPRR